jgi:hypothetical protein
MISDAPHAGDHLQNRNVRYASPSRAPGMAHLTHSLGQSVGDVVALRAAKCSDSLPSGILRDIK